MSDRIPRTLDNPIRCLGIPIDGIIIFGAIWSGFVLFDKPFLGLCFGAIGANLFTRYRTRSSVRKLMRFIYWYLPSEMNFIPGIQGHQRKLTMSQIKCKP
jgi:conjugal transfer pilus assembly protein TraL